MANNFSVIMLNMLSGALDVLREEATIAKMVTGDFRGASAKQGSTVSVSIPVAQTPYAITPASVVPANTDTALTETTFTLDQWRGARFSMTTKELHEIAEGNQFVPGQVGECVRGLVNELNQYLWAKYPKVYGYAGTAGTTPFATTTDAMVDLKQVLTYQRCPEGNRVSVLNPTAESKLLKLTTMTKALERGNTATMMKGEMGELFGFNCFRDRDVPLHTAGTITTGLIAKAATVVAKGAKTFTGTTAASTGACALVVGDVIAIAGHTTTYVLTAAATQASAASDVTLAIEPGLEIALAGSEAITVKGTHRVNLGFDKAAWALAVRTLEGPIEGQPTQAVEKVMTDPVTGLPLKLSYFPGYHSNQFELSWLYGGSVIDPRRAARLAGEAS